MKKNYKIAGIALAINALFALATYEKLDDEHKVKIYNTVIEITEKING